MLKLSFIIVSLIVGAFAQAATDAKETGRAAALKMVADSKVVKEDGNDFDLQTAKGTIVEIELNRDGSIDEASGDAATGGDTFNPGNNLMTLEQATEALRKAGKTPTGEWSFDKSLRHGWIYEFEGNENGKKMEYAINAKDGKLVKDRRDLF